MVDERSQRTAEAAKQSGADWALLTSVDTVCYATGHEVSIEVGPSPFAGGPTTAVVANDGTVGIVVINLEEAAATNSYAQVVRSYEGFGYEYQAPVERNYLRTVLDLVRELGATGRVAVEPSTLPASLREELQEHVTGVVDIHPAFDRIRATKTPQEIEQLRRCAEVTAVGHEASHRAVAAGRRELEIFADIRCAMEVAAGRRLPVTGDLISGVDRTFGCMGWPSDREVQHGDPVICDLAPRVGGYWGDSCNTMVVGDPTPDFMRLYDAASRALEHAVEILRPGITAGQFDADVRGVIRGHGFEDPLHIGHGIGTSSHEYPRLVPQETAVLEPGMVLMVEPGAYVKGVGGVRLEWMLLVTPSGNEVLSPFPHTLLAGSFGAESRSTVQGGERR